MAARSPLRSYDEIQEMTSMWDIGASGAHTKTANVPGTGFTSVARTAAGKYTVTFAKTNPIGPLVQLVLTYWGVADAAALDLRATTATYTAETSAAAATVKYESWDLATPSQAELANCSQ